MSNPSYRCEECKHLMRVGAKAKEWTCNRCEHTNEVVAPKPKKDDKDTLNKRGGTSSAE